MDFTILKKLGNYFESSYIKYIKERKKAERIFLETTGEDRSPLDFWDFVECVASHTKLTMSEAATLYNVCKAYNITKETVVEKLANDLSWVAVLEGELWEKEILKQAIEICREDKERKY